MHMRFRSFCMCAPKGFPAPCGYRCQNFH